MVKPGKTTGPPAYGQVLAAVDHAIRGYQLGFQRYIKCPSFETNDGYLESNKIYTIINSHPKTDSPQDPINTSIKSL